MNNRGQVLLISIMVGIMIFIAGMVFLNFLKLDITTATSSDNLDCDNASGISDGNKVACLVVDIVVPYFIIIIIAFAGGVITSRFVT